MLSELLKSSPPFLSFYCWPLPSVQRSLNLHQLEIKLLKLNRRGKRDSSVHLLLVFVFVFSSIFLSVFVISVSSHTFHLTAGHRCLQLSCFTIIEISGYSCQKKERGVKGETAIPLNCSAMKAVVMSEGWIRSQWPILLLTLTSGSGGSGGKGGSGSGSGSGCGCGGSNNHYRSTITSSSERYEMISPMSICLSHEWYNTFTCLLLFKDKKEKNVIVLEREEEELEERT